MTLAVDHRIRRFLVRAGLAEPGTELRVAVLPGGVSCDVWKVEVERRLYCVKRALPRLRVSKLWQAPIERSETEYNWLNFARTIVSGAVPRVLAHDADGAMIAMDYLDPRQYPVWKRQLLDGDVQPHVAAVLARIVASIHAASAGKGAVAEQFKTRAAFYALRIEPYLMEAARQNPPVADALAHLAERTLVREIALVHGDVSPKNVLVGPEGPVIIDAETAWYGDPAFDVAFCLNHLLLKCVARPDFADAYLSCFTGFRDAYLAGVTWEEPAETEARAAQLLPALLLARIDGKSPVEYLAGPQPDLVRDRAIRLIQASHTRLADIAGIWKAEAAAFTAAAARRRDD